MQKALTRRRLLVLFTALPASLLAQAGSRGPIVLLVIGPPGSGKTTQASKLSRKYQIPSITMADILKKEGGSRHAGGGDNKMRVNVAADVIDDETANSLIDKRLARKDAARGFILDGFPVTAGQADFLEKLLKDRGLPMPIVLHLEVSDALAAERMKARGRSDDKPELMQLRLDEYHKQSNALLARYGGGQVKTVDATKSIDDVWKEIERALGEAKQ